MVALFHFPVFYTFIWLAKSISYNNFVENYIRKYLVGFDWQSTPVQIYPLHSVHESLVLPTPLLHADYYFFIYLNKGHFTQQVGTETLKIKANAILFVPQGEVFSIQSIPEKLNGYFVLIERKVLSAVLNTTEFSDLSLIKPVIQLSDDDSRWFEVICGLLFDELSSNQPNRKIGSGFLQVMLHKLIFLNAGKRTITRQNAVATNFKQLLNEHYNEHHTVTFYAQKLNVSENYLNRCVKAHLNKSCKQVIQEIVILQSQILMFESAKDIREIAFDVGFTDPSHFTRIYKKITGETPSKFKNRIMHGLS